jgi:hypothetical protein
MSDPASAGAWGELRRTGAAQVRAAAPRNHMHVSPTSEGVGCAGTPVTIQQSDFEMRTSLRHTDNGQGGTDFM